MQEPSRTGLCHTYDKVLDQPRLLNAMKLKNCGKGNGLEVLNPILRQVSMRPSLGLDLKQQKYGKK
jgi:hypothetical protein